MLCFYFSLTLFYYNYYYLITKFSPKGVFLFNIVRHIRQSINFTFFEISESLLIFSILIFLKINLFIYFWLHWVFIVVHGLSLVAEHRLQVHGLQQLWLVGSRAQAQQLWHMGLVAPRHVGSSQTRARTRVPCISRRILNHCATREVPSISTLILRVDSRHSCHSGIKLDHYSENYTSLSCVRSHFLNPTS